MIAGATGKKANTVRFGYIVNKRFGNAVKRNKIKRQLKEIFRSIEKCSIDSMDFLIIIKNPISSLNYSEIKEAVINNMSRFMH